MVKSKFNSAASLRKLAHATSAVEMLETRRLLVGTITGSVFNDLNGNGVQNQGEDGLQNYRIYVDANDNGQFDDGTEDFIFSDPGGTWTYGNLPAGPIVLRVDPGAGREVTTPANNRFAANVVDDEIIPGAHFGVREIVGTVRGTVYFDANANGTQDQGEIPLENYQVYVDIDNSGTRTQGDIASFTNAQGQWQFLDLPPGSYDIRIDIDPALLYVSTPVGGFFDNVTVVAGQDESIGAFGIAVGLPPISSSIISGRAFNDANNNGTQDQGEAGLQNVVVYIDANNNGSQDQGEVTVTTNATGDFSFGNLAAGTYVIRTAAVQGFDVAVPVSGSYSRTVDGTNTSTGANFALVSNQQPQPELVLNDFNGDGKPDLFFRDGVTGVNTVWFMDGATRTGTGTLTPLVGAQWVIGGTGDFNGDGKTDLVWHNNNTGETVLWLMDGVNRASAVALPTVNSAWRVYGAGDFDGDGNTDILFRHTTSGSATIWYMDGTALRNNNPFGILPQVTTQNWQIVGVEDFDNDGDPDILWSNVTTKQNSLWLMNNNLLQNGNDAFRGIRYPLAEGWQLSRISHFNNDSTPDLLWRNTATGAHSAWLVGNVANRPVEVTFSNLSLPPGTTIPA